MAEATGTKVYAPHCKRAAVIGFVAGSLGRLAGALLATLLLAHAGGRPLHGRRSRGDRERGDG